MAAQSGPPGALVNGERPSAVGKRLDRVPRFRADIAQSVEQRFRKASAVGLFSLPSAREISAENATDHYEWFRPDRPQFHAVLEQLVDADFELGAWQLDREFARAEGAR